MKRIDFNEFLHPLLTGVTSNVISIAFLDILNLMLLLPEIIYVSSRNWKFSERLCTVYLGIECVINISIFYVTIMTNLQVISCLACVRKYFQEQVLPYKDEDLYDSFDESDEIDEEGYEILGSSVMRSDNQDFHIQQGSHPVQLLLVMTLAVSVSIPFFMYAQKDRIPGMDTSICVMKGLNDPIFNNFIAILVIIVRVLFPSILLICTSFVLLIKHLKASHELPGKPIKISLILSIILIICSLQRVYGSLLFEIYSTKKIGNISGINKPFTQFKYPHVGSNLSAILLTLTHYLSSLLRPFSILMIQCCCSSGKSSQVSERKVTTAIKTINKT